MTTDVSSNAVSRTESVTGLNSLVNSTVNVTEEGFPVDCGGGSKYSFHDMSIHEPVTVQRDELSDWLLATSDDERLPLIHGAENPRTVVAQLPLADDATHDPNVATCATDVEVMPPERLDKASIQQSPCPASRRAILARGPGVRESAEMTLVEPGHESS